MKAYHIKQWAQLYENCETRKLVTLTFYPKRNKLIGEGIGHTLAQPDNLQLLGTWALLEALASMSARDHRGWLVRNGTALTAARMAALVHNRVTADQFQRALDHFSSAEVDWLEQVAFPPQTGSLPGDSPGNPPLLELNPPVGGTPPGDSPGNLPPKEEGEEGSGKEGSGKKKKAPPAGAPRVPTESEVRTWAEGEEIDPDFAALRRAQAVERGDFAKPGWLNGWQSKLARFWQTDAATWRAEISKKTRPPSERPDGWEAGDLPGWWTDPIADLRGSLSGAVMANDEKTAARLRAIIALRGRKKA